MSKVKLLVLRPGPVGSQLAEALCGNDMSARHAPTLAINSLQFTAPSARYDAIIFISPTAVMHGEKLLREIETLTQTVIAVGSGTAMKLSEAGIKDVLIPDTFNSEGLLAMTELQQPADKRILIVKGQGGRPLLKESLIAQGARCETLDVYEREPIRIDENHWDWYWQGEQVRGLTAASVETLSAFDEQRQLSHAPFPDFILTASDRIAEVGRSLGYTDVRTVGGAANHFFITAMEDYLKAHD